MKCFQGEFGGVTAEAVGVQGYFPEGLRKCSKLGGNEKSYPSSVNYEIRTSAIIELIFSVKTQLIFAPSKPHCHDGDEVTWGNKGERRPDALTFWGCVCTLAEAEPHPSNHRANVPCDVALMTSQHSAARQSAASTWDSCHQYRLWMHHKPPSPPPPKWERDNTLTHYSIPQKKGATHPTGGGGFICSRGELLRWILMDLS